MKKYLKSIESFFSPFKLSISDLLIIILSLWCFLSYIYYCALMNKIHFGLKIISFNDILFNYIFAPILILFCIFCGFFETVKQEIVTKTITFKPYLFLCFLAIIVLVIINYIYYGIRDLLYPSLDILFTLLMFSFAYFIISLFHHIIAKNNPSLKVLIIGLLLILLSLYLGMQGSKSFERKNKSNMILTFINGKSKEILIYIQIDHGLLFKEIGTKEIKFIPWEAIESIVATK